MKWPTHTDYQDSIQNPQDCFSTPELKAGTIVCDMLGLPRVMSGNFASVYELKTDAAHWAIRCFVRQVSGQQTRYSKLSEFLGALKMESIVAFEYIQQGILVRGEWFPILKMQWVRGQQLNSYIEDRLAEPEALKQLAVRWRALMEEMRVNHVAHGDLQHGNVMVTAEGELRLVDYDGMYCPAFGRTRSPELGHANFQHPRRTADYYEERLDNFAAIVVYASILALVEQPDLWGKFNMGDNLVFASADFKNTQNSPAFQALKQSPSGVVRELTNLLQQCCIAPIGCTPLFKEAVEAAEQGAMAALIEKVKAQASGPAPAMPAERRIEGTRPAEELPGQARSRPAAPVVGSRMSPEPAPVPQVPVVESAPADGDSGSPGKKSGMVLALVGAAALVVVVAVVALVRGKAPAGSVPGPTPQAGNPAAGAATPAPAQPDAGQSAATRANAPVAASSKVAALKSLTPESGSVTWLGFSSNGRYLATGGEDGSLKLWDPGNGQPKQTFAGQGDGLHAANFLPDGKSVVTVSAENVLRYWAVGTAQPVKTVNDHARNLWAVEVSPDGALLATGAADRKIVRLVEPQSGTLKRMLSQHASWVRAVDFSPDSKSLAVSCWDDTVKVWNVATGEARQTLAAPSNTVDGVIFSPDAKFLAAAGQGKVVKIWDIASGAVKQTCIGSGGEIRSFAFSPNGKLVAAGASDRIARVWDVASGQLLAQIPGHNDAVTAVVFSADGSMFATGGADQTVKLWDISKLSP